MAYFNNLYQALCYILLPSKHTFSQPKSNFIIVSLRKHLSVKPHIILKPAN